eukprot:16344-Hanusia_phi.AAC.8
MDAALLQQPVLAEVALLCQAQVDEHGDRAPLDALWQGVSNHNLDLPRALLDQALDKLVHPATLGCPLALSTVVRMVSVAEEGELLGVIVATLHKVASVEFEVRSQLEGFVGPSHKPAVNSDDYILRAVNPLSIFTAHPRTAVPCNIFVSA